MCLMLFVDVCGDTVPIFSHSAWHGLNLADFVMPGFIFLVGASMGLSSTRRSFDSLQPHRKVLLTCSMRALRLFILGVLVQGAWIPAMDGTKNELGFDIENFRIMGILQRIALVYIVVMSITTYIKAIRYQAIFIVLCLVLQSAVLLYGKVPGCDPGAEFTVSCNAESYVDRLLLGRSHLYKPSLGYDPEGLVATLGCFLPCYCGLLATRIGFNSSRLLAWLAVGLTICGSLLAASGIPLNKALWTPSYSLFTTGVMIGIHVLLKRWGPWSRKNLLATLGMNAILFFLLSDCCGVVRIVLNSVWVIRDGERRTFVDYILKRVLCVDRYPELILVYAAFQLVFYLLLMRQLYKKGIVFKV